MVYDRIMVWLGMIALVINIGCTRNNSPIPLKPLESVQEIVDRMESGERILFIDVRKPERYADGHIPGAIRVYRDQYSDTSMAYNGLMADKKHMENLFSSLGIDTSHTLVLYDAKGQVEAARLWWILNHYGFEKATLLDGGIQAWKRAEAAVVTDPAPDLSVTSFTFNSNPNTELYASKKDVMSALDTEVKIIDCRSAEEYAGAVLKEGAVRAGRIPNSIHIDYGNCINFGGESDAELKSVEEITQLLQSNGISKEDNLILYCHSGVRSAHSTFVLSQILGFKNVRNYDGSWTEWSYDASLPIEKDLE